MSAIAEPVVAPAAETILRIESLSKTFGGTRALIDVDLDIRANEIHALVGQNGSGKSTLIKTLAGYHHPDVGAEAWFQDEQFPLGSQLEEHGRLRFVHQDLGHVLELGVMDNLALRGAYVRGRLGRIRWSEQERVTRELLARFGVEIDLYRPLAEATPVERVVVAIVGAIQGWEGGRGVLVLDEPTAVLPPHEVEQLFELIGEVRRTGASVLYVSHRLDEIFKLADRVTVLRGGCKVCTEDVVALTPRELATLMVGEDVDPDFRAEIRAPSDAPPALEARDLQSRYLNGVSFSLRKGEVLGIAGLPGSGSDQLPYVLAGALGHEAGGAIKLAERDEWLELGAKGLLGLPLVPADRAGEAVVAEMGVGDNLTLPILDRLSKGIALSRSREQALVDDWFEKLQIRAAGHGAPISTLSGGNQQKVVMARCLALEPSVLLLCEPTAGVDIATRIALYKLIAAQAERGLGVIVSSSDVGDLLAMCTRVLVLRDGEIASELPGGALTESILHHAIEGVED
ncbi:MAG TPA: sugar ABC transporter ATP-binding protein [Thermoleophilaceae bacterium]